ncbi:MAG: DUF2953 domain-containing protein [Tuberibacillus sp.]
MILLALAALIALLFVLFVILFLFGIIHIFIDAKLSVREPDVKIKIFLWKIRIFSVEISQFNKDAFPFKRFFQSKESDSSNDHTEKNADAEPDLKGRFNRLFSFGSAMKKDSELPKELFSLFRISHIKWATTIGMDDASITAMAVGVLWAIKGNIMGRLIDWLPKMERPTVDVRPAYQYFVFHTHLSCMITFRLGKTILAIYRIAKSRKRRQVGQCQKNIPFKA